MNRTARNLATTFASFSIMGALLLAIELAVRLAGIDAVAWPSREGTTVGFIRIDPLLGPLPQPNYSGKWFKFDASFDNEGFRTTGFPPLSQGQNEPLGLRKVAFLGDSCTFGWGLEDKLTFIGQLDGLQRSSEPPHLSLRNAGYPGHSAVMGEYVFRQRVLDWQPDIVVIGYSANNAFRFALSSHRQRFGEYEWRSQLLRSQTYRALASRVAVANHTPQGDPRSRAVIMGRPLEELRRVAPLSEFEASTRATIDTVRRNASVPVLLIFPREIELRLIEHRLEDVAAASRAAPFLEDSDTSSTTPRELGLLEVSCLDHLAVEDPIAELHAQSPSWMPILPRDPELLGILRAGSRAYVAGDFKEALARFSDGVALDERSPLARYDLGIAKLETGDHDGGLAELAIAEKLACNVFLSYQVALRRIAIEHDVAVIDLLPVFQAQDTDDLFLDPAHPNEAGSKLIAEALWARLQTM
ncbi:MAG: lysophospholipase L1-like esterase [Hyphomicrobiaceae bacterium]|jgi:lysophospholipase L1-like esterase